MCDHIILVTYRPGVTKVVTKPVTNVTNVTKKVSRTKIELFLISPEMADHIKFEQLNHGNYMQWKQRFEALLVLKKLSAAIEGNGTPTQHKEALAYMRLHVNDDILLLLVGVEDAKAAWELLAQREKVGSVAREMQLRAELTKLQLQHNESIDSYEARARMLQRGLMAAGVKVLDPELAQYILAGLPTAYMPVYSVLVETAAALDVQLDLTGKVLPALKRRYVQLQLEMEREGAGQGSAATALMAHGGGQRTVTCWYCNKPGHVKAQCKQRQRDAGKGNERSLLATVAAL